MSERKPHLWCLFQKTKNRLIEGLLFDEARAFISNLDSKELESWMAWKEEWPDWRPVNEIEGLTEMIFRILPVSPPPPPRGTEENSLRLENIPSINEISGHNSVGHTTFSQAADSGTDSPVTDFIVRDKKRFRKRMQITIVGSASVFKTFTRDVSVGGMNLEDSLPEWVTGNFKARIAKPGSKQQIELTCCVIENQPDGARFRLAILPLTSVADEKNLENWLAA